MDVVSLRSITKEDIMKIFKWRNEPSVRQQAVRTDELTVEEHLAYWERHLADKNEFSYIITTSKTDVGVARLVPNNGIHEVDIYLTEQARNRGMGGRALAELMQKAREAGIREVSAKVRAGNTASRKTFCSAGFKEEYVLYHMIVQK